jgi:hypothetical protein
MRKLVVTAAVGVLLAAGSIAVAAASSGPSQGGRDDNDRRYQIALIGDMPYGDSGRTQFPRVIQDINENPQVEFTVFDGDLKNGKERCDQGAYDLAARNFAAFRNPLVYVPGDNEWTDCDRPSNGSYDANERLALVRRTFASVPASLGQKTIRLDRQSAAYPENVRWQRGPVTYVGLNVTGSDNNAPQFDATGKQVDGDQAEYTGRNAANLQWLDASFAAARAAHAKAVLVDIQADMWGTSDPTAHFADTKKKMAQLAIGFPGQVVLVNGDSHFLRIDKPLADAAGQTIQNFTRVQTFGSEQNHWVSADVDPGDPAVFTFHQHVVASNVPAYVTP